jgi:hypothetical protein
MPQLLPLPGQVVVKVGGGVRDSPPFVELDVAQL